MFGEASEFELDNGNDMLWNPTARVDSGYMYADLSDDPTDEYKVIFGVDTISILRKHSIWEIMKLSTLSTIN